MEFDETDILDNINEEEHCSYEDCYFCMSDVKSEIEEFF
jgi:hypothetical protein